MGLFGKKKNQPAEQDMIGNSELKMNLADMSQGDKLMRLQFTEDLFKSTANGFLSLHNGN
ncbi:MAG: hypothetical protein NC299_12750 [Lachnospiraceae bacterium]|nr:hypothetical protein [Ruminococcus sp.]MCM1276209.1 hypothetical protein [Lachnospiraceae bacterium]